MNVRVTPVKMVENALTCMVRTNATVRMDIMGIIVR